MKNSKNKEVIENYFKAFGKGNTEAILQIFHPACFIMSVREGERLPGQLHGSYHTRKEARTFLSNIQALFIPQSFEVESITVGEDNVVYANGTFSHFVKSTGKLFNSTWVQRCIIEDGMIKEYRFYEDSAAYELAASSEPLKVANL
jgi:ketosteroid isomerase-like protein